MPYRDNQLEEQKRRAQQLRRGFLSEQRARYLSPELDALDLQFPRKDVSRRSYVPTYSTPSASSLVDSIYGVPVVPPPKLALHTAFPQAINPKAMDVTNRYRGEFVPPLDFASYYNLAQFSYRPDGGEGPLASNPDMDFVKVVDMPSRKGRGTWRLVFTKTEAGLIVAVEGTSSLKNWLLDAQMSFRKLESFIRHTNNKIKKVSEETGLPVVGFVGHSAGASISDKLIARYYPNAHGVFFNGYAITDRYKTLNLRSKDDALSGITSNGNDYLTVTSGGHSLDNFADLSFMTWREIIDQGSHKPRAKTKIKGIFKLIGSWVGLSSNPSSKKNRKHAEAIKDTVGDLKEAEKHAFAMAEKARGDGELSVHQCEEEIAQNKNLIKFIDDKLKVLSSRWEKKRLTREEMISAQRALENYIDIAKENIRFLEERKYSILLVDEVSQASFVSLQYAHAAREDKAYEPEEYEKEIGANAEQIGKIKAQKLKIKSWLDEGKISEEDYNEALATFEQSELICSENIEILEMKKIVLGAGSLAEIEQHIATMPEGKLKQSLSNYVIKTKADVLVEKGFYNLAAQEYAKLPTTETDFGLSNTIADLQFQHQVQVYNALLKPVEEMISREVSTWSRGIRKDTAQATLKTLSFVQKFVPSALPLAMAGGQQRYTQGHASSFQRNLSSISAQLQKDLRNPRSFNGAMIYGQAGLMVLEGSSFLDAYVVPNEWRHTVRDMRAATVWAGNIGINAGFGINAGAELMKHGFSHAYSPEWASMLAKIGADAAFATYEWHSKKTGNLPEDMNYYLAKTGTSASLGAIGTTIFLYGITGGFGLVAGTATVLGGMNFYHGVASLTGQQQAAVQALAGCLYNIHYHSENESPDCKTKIVASLQKVEQLLADYFDGLTYNPDHPEIVNTARFFHLYHKCRAHFDNMSDRNSPKGSKGKEVLAQDAEHIQQLKRLTKCYSDNSVSATYRLPAHMAWQALSLQLHVTAETHSAGFADEYKKVVEAIHSSCSTEWHQDNWLSVQKGLNEVVRNGLVNYLITAEASLGDSEKARDFLKKIRQRFRFAKHWYDLLTDRIIFHALVVASKLDDAELEKLFASKIKDPRKLYADLQKEKKHSHEQLMLLTMSDPHLTDELADKHSPVNVFATLKELLSKMKFRRADNYVESLGKLEHQSLYKALLYWHKSNKTAVVETLDILFDEEDKDGNYWLLLYQVISEICDSSALWTKQEGSPHVTAIFYGLLALCIDNLEKEMATLVLKDEIEEKYKLIKSELRIYCVEQKHIAGVTDPEEFSEQKLDEAVENLIAKGYEYLHNRPDSETSLLYILKKHLKEAGYKYSGSGHDEHFIALDVPDDGDCAFHVFGLTRKSAIDLLFKAICDDSWFSRTFTTQKKPSNYTVYKMLLQVLSHHDGIVYDPEDKVENIKRIKKYLQHLKISKSQISSIPGQPGILGALALLQEKNICIFSHNEAGCLELAAESKYGPDCETVNIMQTFPEDNLFEVRATSHYVKLASLATCEVLQSHRASSLSAYRNSRPSSEASRKEPVFHQPDAVRRRQQQIALV